MPIRQQNVHAARWSLNGHGIGAPDLTASDNQVFGENVFSSAVQRTRLPKDVYKRLSKTLARGEALDTTLADAVALAMKEWALEKGATHYTHVFQPLTGLTAEKHDSFYSPTGEGTSLAEFSGKELIQGEPDASSFPTGGIRATFEARGYTAWDPTSPAFILENPNGALLCIPTAFASWTGEALDHKIPLLRSMDSLSKSAIRALKLFGNSEAARVFTTVGPEQEYFLIDEQYFFERPDLITTGRTLFGAKPPKGHELDDHYFGSIPERILAYMLDTERELPEAGRAGQDPPQRGGAQPVRARADLRELERRRRSPAADDADHAERRPPLRARSACCTRSRSPASTGRASTTTGRWAPTAARTSSSRATPRTRTCSSCSSAPPSSRPSTSTRACCGPRSPRRAGSPPRRQRGAAGDHVHLPRHRAGEGVQRHREAARSGESTPESFLGLGTPVLPPLPMHGGDRNRTSPFAFTGNKFEFRALGSSMSLSLPNTVLNTIVAEAVDYLAEELEDALEAGADLESALRPILQRSYAANKQIVFGGDNYSEDWHSEAESRGLLNLRATPDALPYLTNDDTVTLFSNYGVLSQRELESRYEVFLEQYVTRLNIEAETAAAIARTMLLPAAGRHLALLLSAQMGELASETEALVSTFVDAIRELESANLEENQPHEDLLKHAEYMRDTTIPAMEAVRDAADKLEKVVADDLWPLPKYSEILFVK